MRPAAHAKLLLLAVLVWGAFFVAGLPDYYQQYSMTVLVVGTALLVPPTALAGWLGLRRVRPERRVTLALWFSFYGTVPFAALDTLYCGVHLGHGAGYLARYWYLTAFYAIPWVVFVPMGAVSGRRGREST